MRGLLSIVLAALLLSPSVLAAPHVSGRHGSTALKASSALAAGASLVRARDVRSAECTDHELPVHADSDVGRHGAE
jgi:hypothetical protein